jgi:membrane protease YdiL (CAAX protease family)
MHAACGVNVDLNNQNSPEQQTLPAPIEKEKSGKAHGVFFGAHGLRAGWSVLLYCVLAFALFAAFGAIARLLPKPQTGSPYFLALQECVLVLGVLIATGFMAAFEKRSVWSFGLRGPRQWRRFAIGAIWGIVALTIMLLLMRAGGHFFFGGLAESRSAAIDYALIWLGVFFLVGFFEETAFRGYLQYTLARGVGFWPAAVILAAIFGYGHSNNPGETHLGALAAGLFGLFLSLTLKRTGSLWWAIGFHMAWDYSESFIYSVPDSGQMVTGHLLSSHFSGPAWITGGSVGPEGSYFIFLLLAAMAALFVAVYPRSELKKEDYAPISTPRSLGATRF